MTTFSLHQSIEILDEKKSILAPVLDISTVNEVDEELKKISATLFNDILHTIGKHDWSDEPKNEIEHKGESTRRLLKRQDSDTLEDATYLYQNRTRNKTIAAIQHSMGRISGSSEISGLIELLLQFEEQYFDFGKFSKNDEK